MHITIDGRTLQKKPWTGVGHYGYNLLRALFELDRENEYVIWYNAREKLNAPLFTEYDNVQIYRTNWPNKLLNLSIKVLGRSLFLPLRLRGGQEGLRTAHNSPQPSLTLREGAPVDLFFLPNLNFIALSRATKLVIAVHDLSYEHFPEFFSLKSRLWHKAINPRALFSRADSIIAVSEHTKGDLIETYGIDKGKIRVIYPGIEIPNHKSQIPNKSQITNSKFQSVDPYILYFGALEPRKNINGLIKAYELLALEKADLPKLVIAGASTPFLSNIKECLRQSRMRLRVVIKEDPTEEEKDNLYKGACLFVYPSFYEGFGFPPLEAMSYGVPVVASSASSVPEVCGEAALLVSPWNINEIKQGMKILLDDRGVRDRYIAAGYERVKQFSWQKCAEQTLELFKA